MKKVTLLVLLSGFLSTMNSAIAQSLVSWTTFPSSAWNATWPATSVAANITVSGFTKGSGIAGSGTPATGAWGGSGGWGNAAANNMNGSLYFTIKANEGYVLSLTSIPFFYSRRSNSGPTGASVLYSLDGGSSFVNLATVTTSSTTASGTNNPINTLSTHAVLQNIPSTTTVIIKIVPNAASNNWYINSGGIQLNGTVVAGEPLPISLVSFKGIQKDGDVVLKWITASEKNSSYYEIQKSQDAKSFIDIANVSSENKAEGATYSYKDKYSDAVNFYRLKLVDMDGEYSYSNVIKVGINAVTDKEPNITLNSNPVSDQLQFTYSNGQQTLSYSIRNMSGVELKKGNIHIENENAIINVRELTTGLYVLHLHGSNGEKYIKFVKQ